MKQWSYSALKVFEQCPAQYKGRYIDKIKTPHTEKAKWGEQVHKDLEHGVRDKKVLPLATSPYSWALQIGQRAEAIGATVKCEYEMALTRELKPTEWGHNDAWLLGKADLYIKGDTLVSLWDYKTGKMRPGHTQLKIMTAMAFQYEPQVTYIESHFLWLQRKKITNVAFNRDELPFIWSDLLGRARRIEEAYETGIFQKIEGWYCSYCPVLTCEYNKVKK